MSIIIVSQWKEKKWEAAHSDIGIDKQFVVLIFVLFTPYRTIPVECKPLIFEKTRESHCIALVAASVRMQSKAMR